MYSHNSSHSFPQHERPRLAPRRSATISSTISTATRPWKLPKLDDALKPPTWMKISEVSIINNRESRLTYALKIT